MHYANPLAARLGLNADDMKREAKLLRLADDLKAKIHTILDAPFAWHFSEEDMSVDDALAVDPEAWPAFGSRTVWSKKQGHTWFAAEVVVPEAAAGETLVLRFSSQWQDRPGTTDPQCLAYLDGRIAQALDGNHTELVVARNAVPGERHQLRVNAFTFFDRPLTGFGVEFLIRDERTENLYYDLLTPLEVAIRLPQTDGRRHLLLDRVERALLALDRRGGDTGSFTVSLDTAEAIAREIYALPDTEFKPTVTTVGHTHIDVGWLWRVLHSRDKSGRSFATALSMMEEFPQFVFMYNQAVLLDFLKSDYPDIWARLKDKVRSGQFEIEGAMWVEPDANIVSGESMIRQIMFGSRFHKREFGVTPKTLWLPDTFGYSANMPQIMSRSGLDYFVTSKLSWNDTDRHPHDVFFWRGIDGTKTKAHLITAQEIESDAIYTTYNAHLTVSEIMGAWRRFEPKSAHDEILMCYGHGDGGGGPTRDMVARGIRLERGIPGAPHVRMEGIAPFLERLGAAMQSRPERFPVWNGELYLELHRGTLTSMARNKANNRKAERLMREMEFLNTMAHVRRGSTYPSDAMAALWKKVLINQFHDILPGTSIAEVYEDSDADYASVFDAATVADGPWKSAARDAIGNDAGPLQVVNFTSQERRDELVSFAAPMAISSGIAQSGHSMPLQRLVSADGNESLGVPVSVPSLGWAGLNPVDAVTPVQTNLSVAPDRLENALLRVSFDRKGEIVSVFDKTRNREVLAAGATANHVVAYEDKPKNWDAWDIDAYFEEKAWPLADEAAQISVVESGPWRAAIRVERSYRQSRIVQVISLEEGARQITFDTYVDWHEHQTLLKASFPFDLNVSEIRSEIQFGHVKRATHRNTSWDQARFEASMHRWVDMSETDFGAALLNDCKYGYDAVEQTVRLSLLRSPTDPNPDADQGQHRMRYALFVHDGVSDLASVHRAAERFNNPLTIFGDVGRSASQSEDAATFSFARVDATNVTIETIKKAEDSDRIVLRIFEHANQRAQARIAFGIPVRSVRCCNLMEDEIGPDLPVDDNGIVLDLRPFEIATLLIEPGERGTTG